jgi:putative two-component system response regulator
MSDAGRMKRILLVDDDPDFVEVHSAVLEGAGYHVVAAYSGQVCVRIAAAEQPDLIILDMVMEHQWTGSEVARSLRSAEATRSIPLVMITSVRDAVPAPVEPDPVWLPVDLFLEKPVDPTLLLETVAGILGRGRPT